MNTMYNNSPNSETSDFAIISTFSRSFDTSHNIKNRIHLVSSICLIKQTEMEIIGNYLNNYYPNTSEKISYVFILTANLINYMQPDITNKGSLVIIKCSISTFIKNMLFTEESNSLFDNVFGGLNLKSKDFDSICQQSVFIFLNQMWSNVLLNFKLSKVDVRGGSITKRHLLQTVDFQLVTNLLKFFDESVIPNLIYKSFKEPMISSSIPLNYYNKFVDRRIDILNMKVKDVNNISFLNKDPLIYSDKVFEEYISFEKILKSNFELSIEMLITDITNGINSELETLNNTNNKLSIDLDVLSYKKSNIEGLDSQSTKYMTNKDKKRFKKERAQIKSQGILNQLSQLDVQISKLNFNKENIEEKIINKKNELNQFILNNKEYTILDLLNLQKKYTNNNNIFNLKKTRKLNYNINGVVLDNLIPKQ